MHWYNHERINGGRVNQGLPPYLVAHHCRDLNSDQRDETLAWLRKAFKQNNRSQWEGDTDQ